MSTRPEDRDELKRTFERTGEDYERYRPSFPLEAVELLIPERVDAALDLGAGTGKLTQLVLARAGRVYAVDPSAQMLEVLRGKLPTVTALHGSAEAIPLPDGSVDAVVVGQAFHWFDQEAACAEIARVLRPGGTLGLVWNRSVPDCAWDWACGHVAHPNAPAAGAAQPDAAPPGFALAEKREIAWSERIRRDDYIRRWHTVSSFLAASAARHAEMTAQIERILDADPDTAGADILTLRTVADAFRFRRAGR